MIIQSMELKNYRNYENLNIQFDQNTNIFYGDNAQGKTNLLEAVYVSGTTKSHKGSKDREIIRFGETEAHICVNVLKKDSKYKIDLHLKKNKAKGIAINGIPIKKASELFGIVNMVFFSPEDLNMIKNGPSERRRFLNLELSQLDKVYLYHLMNYNRVINQRNTLLKEAFFREDLRDTLSVWDEQLIHLGIPVIERRQQFIEKLNEIVYQIHYQLTGKKEKIKIVYEPCVTVDQFEQQLALAREKDLKLKTTSVGPHRDDINFLVDDVDIRKYGSQGQQRTAALSLKLAEIELVKRTIHDTPILLLDDVLSELDSKRQTYLLEQIHNIQTLISCTGLDEFISNRFPLNKIFRVIEGKVTVEN